MPIYAEYAITKHQILAVLLFVAVVLPADFSHGDDWPQFLGPQRNGISAETGLLGEWPSGGPKEVWRVAGGVGMSGLAIRDGQLVTMVQRGGKQVVVSHNAETGKSNWQTEIGPDYRNQMGNGPRATPTMTGDMIFTFSGEGVLTALKSQSGDIVWQRNTVKELRGKVADYGMASSPLVVGESIVVTVGAPKATVVALDRKTGETVWSAGSDAAGYSSPTLLKVGGREQVVAYTGSSVLGLAPQSGDILWRYPYKTDYNCNTATPIAHDQQVFISSGENHGAALLVLHVEGDIYQVKEAWTSQGARSVMRNEWQTSVLLGDYLYGLDNVGSAGPVTHLNCVNVKTGQRVWQKTRFGKSNLIAADGKLFLSTMKGELVIVRATPDGFDELGRGVVIGTTRQAPALANGLLYLRDDREIVCLDVRNRN